MHDEQLLTVVEVAQRMRTTPETVRRWLREGKLKGQRPGGTKFGWRIASSDLARVVSPGVLHRTDPDMTVPIGRRAPKDYRERESGVEDFVAPYVEEAFADAARRGLIVRVVRLVETSDRPGNDIGPWIDHAEIWFEPAGLPPRFEVASS